MGFIEYALVIVFNTIGVGSLIVPNLIFNMGWYSLVLYVISGITGYYLLKNYATGNQLKKSSIYRLIKERKHHKLALIFLVSYLVNLFFSISVILTSLIIELGNIMQLNLTTKVIIKLANFVALIQLAGRMRWGRGNGYTNYTKVLNRFSYFTKSIIFIIVTLVLVKNFSFAKFIFNIRPTTNLLSKSAFSSLFNVFFTYGGIETCIILSHMLENPKTDQPKSLLLSMLALTLIYLAITVLYFGAVDFSTPGTTILSSVVTQNNMYKIAFWCNYLVVAILLVSLLSWTNILSLEISNLLLGKR